MRNVFEGPPHRCALLVLALHFIFLAACSEMHSSRETTRWLRLSEVRIAEDETQYVGLPTMLHEAPSGDFFVTDAQRGTVWQITRAGAIARGFGASGDGPGEFRQPDHILADDDSLFVINGTRRRLVAFGIETGEFGSERELPPGLSRLAAMSGELYGLSLAAAPDQVLFAPARDEWTPVGPRGVPSILTGRDELRAVFDGVVVDQDSVGMVAVFQVSDSLYEWTGRLHGGEAWGPPKTSPLPVRLRKGARADLLERASSDQNAAMEALYGTSIPIAISGARDRRRVLFYDPERIGERVLGRYVLAWQQAGEWCESEVPVDLDPRPALTLLGDTVFAFTQVVRDGDRVGATLVSLILQADAPCAPADTVKPPSPPAAP